MLYVLAVILLIAWLLGVVGTYTIGASFMCSRDRARAVHRWSALGSTNDYLTAQV